MTHVLNTAEQHVDVSLIFQKLISVFVQIQKCVKCSGQSWCLQPQQNPVLRLSCGRPAPCQYIKVCWCRSQSWQYFNTFNTFLQGISVEQRTLSNGQWRPVAPCVSTATWASPGWSFTFWSFEAMSAKKVNCRHQVSYSCDRLPHDEAEYDLQAGCYFSQHLSIKNQITRKRVKNICRTFKLNCLQFWLLGFFQFHPSKCFLFSVVIFPDIQSFGRLWTSSLKGGRYVLPFWTKPFSPDLSFHRNLHQSLDLTPVCTKSCSGSTQSRISPATRWTWTHSQVSPHFFWICLHLIFQTFVFSFFFSFFSAVSDFVFSFYNFYLKWIVHIDLFLSSNYFLSSRHRVLFQHDRDRGNNETTFNTIFDHQHTHG